MTTCTELLSALKGRLPNTRRKSDFYRKLDGFLPDWGSVVSAPEFASWMTRIDSESGACMFDRLNALWQDPLYSSENFAALLRLFVRWKRDRDELRTPSGRQGCLPDASTPPAEHAPYPVLSDKYEVLGLLGRGGGGEVYLVWSRETTSLYALKTIRGELAVDPGVRQSFRNEARAWIRLGEHPNVAKAYFFEELGPHLYMTMAFVEGDDDGTGPSLADKLAVAPISLDKLCVWFCQVADGLGHGYGHGIQAHRDIKPANILIGRDGIARISDFGLAVTAEVLLAAGTHDGLVEGTPLFMSPEQFESSVDCDQRSDLYSLGVTLYQAASGGSFPFSPNFSPRTPQELHRYFSEVRSMHEHAQPKPLSSPLWSVIERCLSKRPEDRFADIEEFRSAIGAVAHRQGLSVPERGQAARDFWVLRDQGNSLMRLGNYEEAIKAFDAFLAVIGDESAAFNRAVCLENLRCHAEALEVYEWFAGRNDVRGLVNGSNCLRSLGRKEEALAYAQRAVELDASDVDCWISLGNAAYALARWKDAMRAYSAAHDLDRSVPTPAYNLGLAAERAGAIEAAQQAYSMFLQISLLDDSRRQYVEKAVRRIGARSGSPK
jgi:eukaryotic-like serine/threonine-protein kinase